MKLFNLLFKKKNKNSFALPVSADYSFHAETLPRLLKSFNVFHPSYISLISASYSKNKPIQTFEPSDLLPNIEPGYASWVLNHCLLIVSARQSVLQTLENAKKAEAKFIDFEVFRPCSSCDKIPKNKRFKLSENIPIFPCEDCKEENICLFAYNLRW